jgi:hypothetical protein
MDKISIQDFAKAKGFIEINKTIRTNTNGYPFVTFINAKNEAENVYFSKGASAQVAEGGNFFDVAKDYEIGETTNAEGEVRVKLCRKGGDRMSIADLF